MSCCRSLFRIRITHLPTGESITVTDLTDRSMAAAHRKGLRALISRVRQRHPRWMPLDFHHNYELPGDVQYPNELLDYREDTK